MMRPVAIVISFLLAVFYSTQALSIPSNQARLDVCDGILPSPSYFTDGPSYIEGVLYCSGSCPPTYDGYVVSGQTSCTSTSNTVEFPNGRSIIGNTGVFTFPIAGTECVDNGDGTATCPLPTSDDCITTGLLSLTFLYGTGTLPSSGCFDSGLNGTQCTADIAGPQINTNNGTAAHYRNTGTICGGAAPSGTPIPATEPQLAPFVDGYDDRVNSSDTDVSPTLDETLPDGTEQQTDVTTTTSNVGNGTNTDITGNTTTTKNSDGSTTTVTTTNVTQTFTDGSSTENITTTTQTMNGAGTTYTISSNDVSVVTTTASSGSQSTNSSINTYDSLGNLTGTMTDSTFQEPASEAECGVPGKLPCTIAIDETGTPTGNDDMFSGLFSGTGIDDFIEGIGTETAPDSPTVSMALPLAGSCQSISIVWRGVNVSIPGTDGCAKLEVMKTMIGYMFYFITVIYLFQLATRKPL